MLGHGYRYYTDVLNQPLRSENHSTALVQVAACRFFRGGWKVGFVREVPCFEVTRFPISPTVRPVPFGYCFGSGQPSLSFNTYEYPSPGVEFIHRGYLEVSDWENRWLRSARAWDVRPTESDGSWTGERLDRRWRGLRRFTPPGYFSPIIFPVSDGMPQLYLVIEALHGLRYRSRFRAQR